MPEELVNFPWRIDPSLYEEAMSIPKKRFYEDWSIYMFGFQMGVTASKLEIKEGVPLEKFPIDIVFRNKYPDAILLNQNTKEVLNIEFEEFSSTFKDHIKKDDPSMTDLIVCTWDDWDNAKLGECPADIYEIVFGRLKKGRKK